jgi:hypothetical protein
MDRSNECIMNVQSGSGTWDPGLCRVLCGCDGFELGCGRELPSPSEPAIRAVGPPVRGPPISSSSKLEITGARCRRDLHRKERQKTAQVPTQGRIPGQQPIPKRLFGKVVVPLAVWYGHPVKVIGKKKLPIRTTVGGRSGVREAEHRGPFAPTFRPATTRNTYDSSVSPKCPSRRGP